MVGALEQVAFRLGIVLHGDSERLRDRPASSPRLVSSSACTVSSSSGKIGRSWSRLMLAAIRDSGTVGWRDEPARAEQPLLLAGHAANRIGRRKPLAVAPLGEADQQRDIGRIVERAVVEPVAVDRLAVAVAVEVRGQDDRLVGRASGRSRAAARPRWARRCPARGRELRAEPRRQVEARQRLAARCPPAIRRPHCGRCRRAAWRATSALSVNRRNGSAVRLRPPRASPSAHKRRASAAARPRSRDRRWSACPPRRAARTAASRSARARQPRAMGAVADHEPAAHVAERRGAQ